MKLTVRKMLQAATGLLCATAALSGTVNADVTRNLCYSGIGLHETVRVNYLDGAAASAASRTSGAYAFAGELRFEGGIKAFASGIDNYMAWPYCAEYTKVDIAATNPTPMGALRAAVMKSHYAQNYGSMMSSGDASLVAAFAMVVWEIAQENWGGTALSDLDIHLGAMQFNDLSGETEANATAMIANLSDGGSFQLDGWTNPDYQDLIIVVPGPSIALAGVIGLAGLRRRRRA